MVKLSEGQKTIEEMKKALLEIKQKNEEGGQSKPFVEADDEQKLSKQQLDTMQDQINQIVNRLSEQENGLADAIKSLVTQTRDQMTENQAETSR